MPKKELEDTIEKIKSEINEDELTPDMFIGFNEKGEKKTFYKLLEFDSKDGVHYLAYTDNETDEKGNLKAYGSILQKDEEKGLMKLKPITNEKEWKVIEMALKVLQEEAGNNK